MSSPADRGELPQLLSIATLTRAHGVRGELRIRCAAGMLDVLRDAAAEAVPLTLRLPDSGDEYEVTFAGVRGHESAPIVAIDGVEDRTSAELFRGAQVLAARELLPPPAPDEFFLADLHGCDVHASSTGARIGTITRAEALPANVVLTITLDEGGTALAPLVDVAVPVVDVDARRIDVDVDYLGIDMRPEVEPT